MVLSRGISKVKKQITRNIITCGRFGLNLSGLLAIILMCVIVVGCDPIPGSTPIPTSTMTNFQVTGTANAISYWATKTANPSPTPMPTKKLTDFEKCEQSGIGVRLVVDGKNVSAVSLTWQNDTNGTEQGDYKVPFCKPYLGFSSSDFLYISAQIILPTSGAGSITCKIYDGNEILAEASASGFPNIATCSTSKP